MKVFICFIMVAIAVQSEAIRCSVCTHSYSLEKCISEGVKYCNENEDMCESVRRPEPDGRMVYIKQCKSSVACKNNPKDHNKEVCCCKGDLCNFDHDECNGAPPPTCNLTLGFPQNGKIQCGSEDKSKVEIGSACRISCDKGFRRRGPTVIKCIREDTGKVRFNPNVDKFPRCVPNGEPELPVRDEPPPLDGPTTCKQQQIAFGITLCMTPKAEILKGNEEIPIESKCVYRCCRGFQLVGADEATCVRGRKGIVAFDYSVPTCVKRPGFKINRQIQQ